MPRANWNVSANEIDDWDRGSQYVPYSGPVPPNAVYQWAVQIVKFQPGDRTTKPRINIGLVLEPRDRDEKKFAGYTAWKNTAVTDKNQFTYVPFLDAIGVSGADFENRTITDEEGNVKRIGAWRNDGQTLVLAQLQDNDWVDAKGNERTGKAIGWIGVATNDDDDPLDDDDEYEDDEGF